MLNIWFGPNLKWPSWSPANRSVKENRTVKSWDLVRIDGLIFIHFQFPGCRENAVNNHSYTSYYELCIAFLTMTEL